MHRLAAVMIALGCGCAAPEPPCSPWVDSRVTAEPPRSNVDLLVVLDDTSSMAARQDRLVANLQTMVRRLVTGDVDDDGDPDAPPVALHLGFVSSSLGAGPIPCRDEDGRLLVRGDTAVEGCRERYGGPEQHYLAYDSATGSDVSALLEDLGCIARAASSGCGIEQPLEAALRTLTPSTSSTVAFARGHGHSDGFNAGFLRPDSWLGILFVTDDDDCSVRDESLFVASSPREAELRCFYETSRLQPIERYVSGFLDAVRGDSARLFVGVIAGVPLDVAAGSEAIDLGSLLDDPRMRGDPDPTDGNRPVPACTDVTGRALPARRLVTFARELGYAAGSAAVFPATGLASVCAPEQVGALHGLWRRAALRLPVSCAPSGPAVLPDGTPACRVRATLLAGRCAEQPGAPPCVTPEDEPGCATDPFEPGCCVGTDRSVEPPAALGQICQIPPREEGIRPGWYREPTDESACYVRFDDAVRPSDRTIIRLECLRPCSDDTACSHPIDALRCIDGLCRSATCG